MTDRDAAGPGDPDERGPAAAGSAAAGGDPDARGPHAERPMLADELPPVVDWARTGRRMATSLAVIGGLIVVTWLTVGVVTGGVRARLLGELVGIGLLAAFLVEVVVVGGAALRGVIRAGDRGDRLAGSDVSLLPPQVRRRRDR